MTAFFTEIPTPYALTFAGTGVLVAPCSDIFFVLPASRANAAHLLRAGA